MATITRPQLEQITDALDLDYDDVREDYSGRSMYGRTCLGFTTDATAYRLGVIMARVLGDEADDLSCVSDSMGMGMIYYFPGLTVED